MNIFKSQRGAVDLIVGVLVVGLLTIAGATIYFKHQAQVAADKAAQANEQTKQTTKMKSGQGPAMAMDNWVTYTSATGKFSVMYDPSWKKLVCGQDPTLYLAPTAAALAICNSGHGSQISISSTAGDISMDQMFMAADGYTKISTSAVTVASVKGTLYKATFQGNQGSNLPAGTTQERYVFVTNGRTYVATYVQSPSGDYSTNVLSDFDMMVTSTLKFN